MDLIVGAGITGLSYASYTANDFLVIEKELEPGGYCKTIKQDGFVWDYSGHFFHFRNQGIKEEIMSGIPEEHLLNIIKHTQIKYKDRLVDYPFQKNIHQLPQQDFIDCLFDLFYNPFKKERSFKEMLYCKFGKSISELFLIPYNEKLYACDLNTLDVDAMGRFFPYANIEEIIGNFRPSKENSYNASFLYTTGGAIDYVYSVLNRINSSRISYGEYLISVDLDNKVALTNMRKLSFEHLISTIPFPRLLEICGKNYDRSLYTSNKVLVFNIGFDKKGNDRRNHWIYYPERNYSFYRVGSYDNIVGSDRLSVYVEIGFKEDDIIDQEMEYNLVLNDLKKAGWITDHKVVSSHSVVMDPAYVHITKEMDNDKELQMKSLSDFGIYSIGRYGGWTYCSIEDNIKEAKSLAVQLNGCHE